MSKDINDLRCLSSIDLNQEIASSVFRHWFIWVCDRMSLLMLSSIALLTLPSWLFAGLIRRHFGLFSKSGLWSFREMKAFVLLIGSTRFEMFSILAMFWRSFSISSKQFCCACL